MADYGTSEVAELLGVSVDTVRRLCDDGKLKSRRDRAGRRIISGVDLARHLRAQGRAYEPASVLGQSARNRFTGIVTSVERDKLTAIVEIHAGPHRIVSLMTREAADELGLAPGDLATAAVKSTNVVVEVPR